VLPPWITLKYVLRIVTALSLLLKVLKKTLKYGTILYEYEHIQTLESRWNWDRIIQKKLKLHIYVS